jgi:hypothetical protein
MNHRTDAPAAFRAYHILWVIPLFAYRTFSEVRIPAAIESPLSYMKQLVVPAIFTDHQIAVPVVVRIPVDVVNLVSRINRMPNGLFHDHPMRFDVPLLDVWMATRNWKFRTGAAHPWSHIALLIDSITRFLSPTHQRTKFQQSSFGIPSGSIVACGAWSRFISVGFE